MFLDFIQSKNGPREAKNQNRTQKVIVWIKKFLFLSFFSFYSSIM